MSSTPGLALNNSPPGSLEKWVWLHHFSAGISVFPGHRLGQVEQKPLSCPDAGLQWKPLQLAICPLRTSTPPPPSPLQGPAARAIRPLLPLSFPKSGFLIFPAEQQWIGLVCLFLPRRGWFLTMGRSLPASCSAKGWTNEQQLSQSQSHPAFVPKQCVKAGSMYVLQNTCLLLFHHHHRHHCYLHFPDFSKWNVVSKNRKN